MKFKENTVKNKKKFQNSSEKSYKIQKCEIYVFLFPGGLLDLVNRFSCIPFIIWSYYGSSQKIEIMHNMKMYWLWWYDFDIT